MGLLGLRTVLVTGHGGVGKTTVACALARSFAGAGKRVLLVEVLPKEDGAQSMAGALGVAPLGDEPTAVDANLSALRLGPAAGLTGLASDLLPASLFDRGKARSTALRSFLAAVPSLEQLGVLYGLHRLARGSGRGKALTSDTMIVDLPSPAYTRSLVELPRIFAETMPRGSFATTVRACLPRLSDGAQTGLVVVTRPEPGLVDETLETLPQLSESGLHVAAIVANRVPYDAFVDEERGRVRSLFTGTSPVLGQRAFARLERSRRALRRLETEVPESVAILQLFEVWLDGPRLTADLASTFALEAQT